MKVKSKNTLLILVRALFLSACQTQMKNPKSNSSDYRYDTQEHRHMNRRVYGLVTRSDEEVYKTYQKYLKADQCVEFKQDYHYR